MTLITVVFRILRTPKNMVSSMPEKSRFRVSVEKQHGECTQALFTFEEHPLPNLLITGKSVVLRKVSVSEMQNLKSVS